MNKRFTLLSLLLSVCFHSQLKAQIDSSLCIDFEQPSSRIIKMDTSVWKIGSPTKNTLNGSLNSSNSIVTRLDSNYSSAAGTSSFVYIYYVKGFGLPNYLGYYGYLFLSFDHRFEINPGDYATVEFSVDNGDTWHNLLNPNGDFSNFRQTYHKRIDNDSTILLDTSKLSGSSNVWLHSQLSSIVSTPTDLSNPRDTLQVKFTLISQVNSSNEGWQIDNLCLNTYLDLPDDISVEEKNRPGKIYLFPNPIRNDQLLNLNHTFSNSPVNYQITNSIGQKIMEHQLSESNTISVAGLKPGLYFITFSNENQKVTSPLVVR